MFPSPYLQQIVEESHRSDLRRHMGHTVRRRPHRVARALAAAARVLRPTIRPS